MSLWYISFLKFRNLSDRAIGVTRDRVDADSTFEVVHNSAIFACILGSHFYYVIVKKNNGVLRYNNIKITIFFI